MRFNSIGVTLAMLAVGGFVQPAGAESCTRQIQPSAAYLKKVDRLVKRLRADKATRADFKTRLLASADTAWVCTKNDSCCTNVPLTVAKAQSSTTSCDVTVAFPYSELRIERDRGNYKPRITWMLKFDGVPADYQFGAAGIKIELMGGHFPPVHTQGSDKCKAGASTAQFECKANGKKDAQAGHLANVFPTTHVDDPKYRCDNIDPLIVNAEN